jgi:hypothetical protein
MPNMPTMKFFSCSLYCYAIVVNIFGRGGAQPRRPNMRNCSTFSPSFPTERPTLFYYGDLVEIKARSEYPQDVTEIFPSAENL